MIERKRKRNKQTRFNSQFKKRVPEVLHSCHYCKLYFLTQDLTVEHLIPLSFGGTNDLANLVLACETCNQNKGKESWELKRKLMRAEARIVPNKVSNEA
jgi:5-methylcytosine-specific restriction protein A